MDELGKRAEAVREACGDRGAPHIETGLSPADFTGCRHAHMEGYLFFNPALATAVVDSVRSARATLSVDLASFEVVRVAREWIFGQLRTGIDVVFANEDEVRSLFETDEPYDVLARRLASFGGTACVKLGKDGAWIARGDDLQRIPPVLVTDPVDTTGAGDAWAAGFLFGHLNNWPIEKSGALGSVIGAATVRQIGHALPPAEWERIRTLLPVLAAT